MQIKTEIENYLALFKHADLVFKSMKSEEIEPKTIVVKRILPLTLLCAVASGANLFFYQNNATFGSVCVQFLFEFIATGVAFFVSIWACKRSLKNPEKFSQSIYYQFISTVFAIICAVTILIDLTNLFFLGLLAFYLLYLLWVAAEALFEINENSRGKFMLFNFLSVCLVKILIYEMLVLLVPNLKL